METDPRLDKVYGVQLEVKDYVEQKGGKPLVDYDDYLNHPEKYQSNFHKTVTTLHIYFKIISFSYCKL